MTPVSHTIVITTNYDFAYERTKLAIIKFFKSVTDQFSTTLSLSYVVRFIINV